jgi:hypothetical protein
MDVLPLSQKESDYIRRPPGFLLQLGESLSRFETQRNLKLLAGADYRDHDLVARLLGLDGYRLVSC